MIAEEQASWLQCRVGSGGSEVGTAVGSKILLHPAESATPLPHGEEAATFALQQEDEGSQRIEPEADEEDTAQAPFGQYSSICSSSGMSGIAVSRRRLARAAPQAGQTVGRAKGAGGVSCPKF